MSGALADLAERAKAEGLEAALDVPLAPLTTLRIGGPAALLITARSPAEVARGVRLAAEARAPWAVLGGGSNLLVADEGFPGVLVAVRAERVAAVGHDFEAEAGAQLARVVSAAAWAGLGDLTFAAGIPGTVGGGVTGNAGAWGRALGECVGSVTLLRARTLETVELPGAELGFDYRTSAVQASGDVVLSVRFALQPSDRKEMLKQIDAYVARRAQRLPDQPSAGSFFRNLPAAAPGGPREPVAKLLDAVGAKGLRIGDAAVSEKHANVLVNLGLARARDVLAIAAELEKRVFERFGVTLVREVRLLGTIA